MAKFKNIESAVRKTLNAPPSEPKHDENVSDNKPLSSEKKTRMKPKITSDTKPPKKQEMPIKKEKKPAVPRAKEQLKLVFFLELHKSKKADRQPKNYMKTNAQKVVEAKPKMSEKEEKDLENPDFGKIPK